MSHLFRGRAVYKSPDLLPPSYVHCKSFWHLHRLLDYNLSNMNTTRQPSDLNRMMLFLDVSWKFRTNAKDSITGNVIEERDEKMIKKCAVLANLAQTMIRKVWIQQKLKPTAEVIQFSVKEMMHIF